jgi:hypothetical protein
VQDERAVDAALGDVLAECDRQVDLGFTVDHDDRHSTAEWIVLMTRYLGKTGDAAETHDAAAYRHRLVEVTAIGLQALRSLDRAVAG